MGKLAKQFFAISPFVLVLGVGLGSRAWHKSAFHFLTYSKAEDSIVEGYRSVTALAESDITGSRPSSSDVREVLDKWSSGFRDGILKPMMPAFEDEESEIGVRSEIQASWVRTVNAGMNLVRKDVSTHDWKNAVQDSSKVLDVVQSFRFSDTGTCVSGSQLETQLIGQIKTIYEHADKSTRAYLLERVKSMSGGSSEFKALAHRLRLNAQAYDSRQQEIQKVVANDGLLKEENPNESSSEESRTELETAQLASAYQIMKGLKKLSDSFVLTHSDTSKS